MKRLIFIIVSLLFSSPSIHAVGDSTNLSLSLLSKQKHFLPERKLGHINQIPDTVGEPPDFKFVFCFDSRISFVFDKNTRLSGIKIGAEVDEKDRGGIGWYSLKNPVILNNIELAVDSVNEFNGTDTVTRYVMDTVNVRTHYSYLTVFVEHIWISTKRWELTTPFQLGMGGAKLDYFNERKGHHVTILEFPFLVTEVSVTGHYKFFSWVGIGVGLGYRAMISANPAVLKAFNAPIFIAKLKLFPADIYRGIFKKDKKDQE